MLLYSQWVQISTCASEFSVLGKKFQWVFKVEKYIKAGKIRWMMLTVQIF